VASALVKLVTAQAVSRETLPVAVSLRRRVILMAWRARGKSSRLAWTAFRVRVSMRPWPVSRVTLPAGTCRQGSPLTWACSSGWFFFTTAM
jgi:hypothetical protein